MTIFWRIIEWLTELAPGRAGARRTGSAPSHGRIAPGGRQFLPGGDLGERAAMATLMLEAGVRPTMAEWLELSPQDRAALAAAGRELWLRRTRVAALACGGDLDALRFTAELDDGEAHDDLVTVRALAGGA